MGQEVVKTEEAENSPAMDLAVKGRFERYNSPFLQLVMPLLSVRYVWLTLEDLNPFNFLGKPHPETKPGFVPWEDPPPGKYFQRNFASIGMGATALAVISYYSQRTYDDIRTLYAEAVGYELDKKPQDVTIKDIFVNSHNAALEVTRDAFIKRTLMRMGAAGAFMLPWHKLRDFKVSQPKYDANVNAGVGVMGVYLSLDGFLRKPSFFDVEQTLMGSTVNNPDNHETIKPKNIQSLLVLQRRHMNKNYKWPDVNTPEAQLELAMAERIASLMNQTYHNAQKIEAANFTIGKFNYLVGFGLLDKGLVSHGFVELANKSADMKDVNKAAKAIGSGQDPRAVFASFGIQLDAASHNSGQAAAQPMVTRFTDRVQSAKDKVPQTARTHQEMAARSIDPLSPIL